MTLVPSEPDVFTAIADVIATIIGLVIPATIFLSGALAVVLSYLFGRRLLRWLLRFVTRAHTLYFVVHSDMAGELNARLNEFFRAHGVLLRGLEAVPTWGTGPALVKARVKVSSRFKARSALARLGQGAIGIAGVQDFYLEG